MLDLTFAKLIQKYFCPICPGRKECLYEDSLNSKHWEEAMSEATLICETFHISHEEFIMRGLLIRLNQVPKDESKESKINLAMKDFLD